MFVIDTSISMQPYINDVRDTVRAGVRHIAKQAATNASLRFGLWGYRDDPRQTPGIEYNTKNYTPTLQPINDFEKTLGEVKEARASDKDYPEDVFSGMHKALTETSWRQGALRFLLLIGDAPGHELGHPQNLSGHDETTLRSFANDQKVYIMAFYIKNPRYSRFDGLAARQFRQLADNMGVQKGPTYADIPNTGERDTFNRHLQGVFAELVQIVTPAKRGPGSRRRYVRRTHRRPSPPTWDMRPWCNGSVVNTSTPAPRDITAWAVDKDLLNFDMPATGGACIAQ